MVTVSMLERGGRLVGFASTGHADHAASGHDVVCSAISALTQACILGLTDALMLKPDSELTVRIDEKDGIRCVLASDTSEEQRRGAELLFQTLELGLLSIKQSYRRAIKIQHREV